MYNASMIDLTKEQKKALLARAHTLHPVVMIGNKGLTQAVDIEIERALDSHELIKIKIAGADRSERQQSFQKIAEQHDALLINTIGFIGTFYRPNPEK